ncbi:MAG: Hsp20/alpha crystallin family protein [Waddliaceae bacterium]
MPRKDLIPEGERSLPSRVFDYFDQFFEELVTPVEKRGMTLSEDDENIYVEAALPGLKSEDIEVHLDNGTLWIKGEKKTEEEDNKKKFYRKAQRLFSYSLILPKEVDEEKLEALFENGLMKVTFKKEKTGRSKKISFKTKR